MSKTNSYSIFQADGTTKALLVEAYTAITDQIQKASLFQDLRAQEDQLSGDPMAGSVLVHRLKTSAVQAYGTARTAGEGNKLEDNDVTLNIDQRKEIVEEVYNRDIDRFGVPAMIQRRSTNFGLSFARYLDTIFFAKAESEGTEATLVETALVDKVEELIQTLETVSNDNVDGVDRELMTLSLKPYYFGKLRNYIDSLANPNGGGVDINMFHGVRIVSNTRQTEDAIIMVNGSIALVSVVDNFITERIPFSNETALEMFFNYGCKAVMADLIFYANLGDDEPSA